MSGQGTTEKHHCKSTLTTGQLSIVTLTNNMFSFRDTYHDFARRRRSVSHRPTASSSCS